MTFIKLNLKEWRLIYFITACQFFSASAKVTKERVPKKKKKTKRISIVWHISIVCVRVFECLCVCARRNNNQFVIDIDSCK